MRRNGLFRVLAAGAFCLVAAARAAAGTRCVNQSGSGGCTTTISAALAAASDGDVIQITAGANPYYEHLTITKEVLLEGVGGTQPAIDGSHSGQVVFINTPIHVTLSKLTIQNGLSGDGSVQDQWGGGIHNEGGTLTLNECVVALNATGGGNTDMGGSGGGIANLSGTVTLNGGVVVYNHTATPDDATASGGGSGGSGGGIFNGNGGTLIVNGTLIGGNATGDGGTGVLSGGGAGLGGGIYNGPSSTVVLNGATVVGNKTGNGGSTTTIGGTGGMGGGIAGSGSITLNRSTINANETGAGGTGATHGGSGWGGGVWCACTLSVQSSTVSGNSTGLGLASSTGGRGGGIYLSSGSAEIASSTIAYNLSDPGQSSGGVGNNAGTVTLRNSLFAFNRASSSLLLEDCGGTITSLGFNVMMQPDCTITAVSGDQFYVGGTILEPLGDNGGPTFTHALASDSPALDAAYDAACPATDQRGVKRPIGAHCDVGAFENEPIGDANGDGILSAGDVFWIINYLFSGGPSPLGRADVNADQVVSIDDVFYLINYLFAGGAAPK